MKKPDFLRKTLCYPCIAISSHPYYVSPVIDIDKKSKQKTVSLFF